MRHTYDCEKALSILQGELGIRRDLAQSFEEYSAHNALRNVSVGFLTDAVGCLLVNLPADAMRLLQKAQLWIEAAISQKEVTVGCGGHSLRFQRELYSMLRWLNKDMHDSESLSIWLHDTLWFLKNHPAEIDSVSLGLEAVSFLDAGAYAELITAATSSGIDSIKCSPANEKQMALTLAVQALTQKFPEQKVQAATTKFLDNHVGKWLKDGHAVRTAHWMKVIYWKRGEAGLSPSEAVRKCLEHVDLVESKPTNAG